MAVSVGNEVGELVSSGCRSDKIRIAPLSAGDLGPYSRLLTPHALFEPYGLTPERLRDDLADLLRPSGNPGDASACRGSALVAEVGGEPAGLVWLVRKAAFMRSGYIRLVVVSPGVQGTGVADALMDAAEDELLAEGPDVLLLVNASNGRARRFYERRGYLEVGELPDYVVPGQTECIYRKCQRA